MTKEELELARLKNVPAKRAEPEREETGLLAAIGCMPLIAVGVVIALLVAIGVGSQYGSRSSAYGAPQTPRGSSTSQVAPSVPRPTLVDGVTYTGEEQVEAMTRAARDAGMDEATARRTGEEAAMLCNGDPECLK